MSGERHKEEAILCDMCTGEDRKPARKTCMKCEISMCVQHLEAHLTTPVLLQTHPLTEPMALSGNTKCPQHGKLLEYYCLDDLRCVCVSCAIEDQHRLHNMKTFSTAHKELMEKLKAEQQALQVKIDDKNVGLEKWEKSEREKLGHCSGRLIEAVTNQRDICLISVQSSVSARMESINTSKSSINAAQKEKDTFKFLQMYSQVHQDVEKAKTVDLRKGLEPGSDRDKLVQEIRQGSEDMTKQTSQFWGSLLNLVDPENNQELVSTDSNLIFDLQDFNPSISLSKDNRTIFYHSWLGQCSATLLIRSTKSVANFQRWVFDFSEEINWTIGLCDKQSARNLKEGPVYGLSCEGGHLSHLTTEYEDISDASVVSEAFGMVKKSKKLRVSSAPIRAQVGDGDEAPEQPGMVEVVWNVVAATLSFFSRTGQYQREEMITVKMSPPNWDLVPFVKLGRENKPQQQWQCSCGKVYTKEGDYYRWQGSCYSHQNSCSCGKPIGIPHITEMICELW